MAAFAAEAVDALFAGVSGPVVPRHGSALAEDDDDGRSDEDRDGRCGECQGLVHRELRHVALGCGHGTDEGPDQTHVGSGHEPAVQPDVVPQCRPHRRGQRHEGQRGEAVDRGEVTGMEVGDEERTQGGPVHVHDPDAPQ